MWYNEKENILQSEPPYRGWLHHEEVPILYPEWTQVDDTFIPPTIPPSKEEKLKVLTENYQETIDNLSRAIVVATLKNNTTQVDNLKQMYIQQTTKYKQERDVIING